jgi:predicted ATPase
MITKIEIDGYRLLKGFSAELNPLTVVIGANATGKSTLLDSLQCISQCAEFPLNTVLGWHWGMSSVLNSSASDRCLSWKITVEKPRLTPWEQLPLEVGRPLVYEVVLKCDSVGQANASYEVLRNPEPFKGHTEPYKYMEATPFQRVIFDRKAHHLVPFDQALPLPTVNESSEKTPSKIANELPARVQEAALLLSQIRFINEFPVPSAVRLLLVNMAFYPGFDVTRFSHLRTKAAEIKPIATLVPNGENLGTVLHEMLTRYDYRNSANELRDFLKTAYPTFEEIHTDTTYGTPPQVLVRVREKGMQRSMELSELSDGMLRFLCLATALLSPLSPPFIAIDEPEAGFHPRLLPIVADIIKMASEKTQILVTTHSPDLLNRFDVADIAVMSRDSDEPKTCWHRPGDRKSLVQMLKSVTGDSLGDLLRSGELEAIK